MSTNDQYKRHSIPEVWAWAKLEDICAITDRDHRTPKYVAGGVPLISPKDFNEHGIDLSDLKTVDRSELDAFVKKCNPEFGDVLYSRIGTIGKARKLNFDFEFVALHSLALLKPFQNVVSPEWLLYLMKSPGVSGQARENIKSVGTPDLGLKRMKKFDVPVAPKTEQARIVSKIDELFSRIDEGERALARVRKLVERYRQSVLKAAVTGELTREWREKNQDKLESGEALLARILKARREAWEKAELEKMKARGSTPANDKWKERYQDPGRIVTDYLGELPPGWQRIRVDAAGEVQLGRQRAPDHHSGEFMRPYLRVANVYEERIDTDDVMSMNFTPEEFVTYAVRSGDVLLNEGQSKELVGRPAIYRDEISGCCFTNTLVRFRSTGAILPEFALIVFLHYMKSGHFQRIAKITTNIAHLGAGRFAEMAFPVPPLEEQLAIVDAVKQQQSGYAHLTGDMAGGTRQSASLRRSVLKAAFAGSLVAQDSSDEPASALLERIAAERGADTAVPKRGRKNNKKKTAA